MSKVAIQNIKIRLCKDPAKMRYPTWGDYYNTGTPKGQKLVFEILDHKEDIYTKLTLIHEIVEFTLLEYKGANIEDIDRFDIEFEKDEARKAKYIEPGNDPDCPYKAEHEIAESIARMMCTHLGIDYELYNNCM